MAVKVTSSGPRGAKTYEIRWKNGELYDIADNAYAAKRSAVEARKKEKAYYLGRKNPAVSVKSIRVKNFTGTISVPRGSKAKVVGRSKR